MPTPPQTPVTHNPAAHTVSIGGLQIFGFGEQSGITYEPKTQAEVTKGIDGAVAVNFRSDSRHREVSITVLNGSMGAKNLAIQRAAQATVLSAGGRIAANNYQHNDPQKGTTTNAAVAVFLDDPQGGLEQNAGELTFKLFLINTTETQNTLAVV